MTVDHPPDRWKQARWAAAFLIVFYVLLALIDATMTPPPGGERCAAKIPKWFGCVLGNHESLLGSAIGVAGALYAAVRAWHAIMAQIESDRDLTRMAERAYVTGGPGGRLFDQSANQIGIMSTGMNTGKTPAFPKKVYWGVCKETDWSRVGKNWPKVDEAKCEIWEEVLPPQQKPGERYGIECTAEVIPDDDNYICYGTIVYATVFGREYATSWKHRITRVDKSLKTEALPGGYSSEWEERR
jgi:hypothetical protein